MPRPQDRIPGDLNSAKDQIWNRILSLGDRVTEVEERANSPHSTERIWTEIQNLQKAPAIASGKPVLSGLFVDGNISVTGKVDGYDISKYILARELEEGWKIANVTYYKEFTYVAGALTNIGIWESAAKVTKLFNKDFTYVAGALTGVLMTRLSDGATLTSTLTYVAGALTTITKVAA